MLVGVHFGLFAINQGPCLDPRVAELVARDSEAAGLDSIWVGEHVVLPDPRVPPSPMEPTDPILDPLISLTFVAAVTRSIRLGTGIIILPQRNPLVLAKEIASLDVLSGGRLIFGIGAGYLEPEFNAIGVPLRNHGPRTDEYLAAMRAVWSQPKPSYNGRYVRFSGINAYPRPIQQPGPEVVVGGRSAGALRRTVEQAHGWYGYRLDYEGTTRVLDGLHQALRQYVRPAELGEIEISITPPMPVDLDVARRYAELGVHRLIVRPSSSADAEGIRRLVAEIGDSLVGCV
jgi:probable F420-dependent oxidoreductase